MESSKRASVPVPAGKERAALLCGFAERLRGQNSKELPYG